MEQITIIIFNILLGCLTVIGILIAFIWKDHNKQSKDRKESADNAINGLTKVVEKMDKNFHITINKLNETLEGLREAVFGEIKEVIHEISIVKKDISCTKKDISIVKAICKERAKRLCYQRDFDFNSGHDHTRSEDENSPDGSET